jgi:hypothetical protein
MCYGRKRWTQNNGQWTKQGNDTNLRVQASTILCSPPSHAVVKIVKLNLLALLIHSLLGRFVDYIADYVVHHHRSKASQAQPRSNLIRSIHTWNTDH